jgi:hypothetical protein
MNRKNYNLMAIFSLAIFLFAANSFAQGMMRQGQGMMGQGQGMMGYACPGYGSQGDIDQGIPAKLAKPNNQAWVDKLQEIFEIEQLSKGQYEADSQKFKTNMPYMMIIPQEKNHIQWLTQLFNAYGIQTNNKVPSISNYATLREAYEESVKLEQDLASKYEWLIQNAEDQSAKQLLGKILFQTRMHAIMFSHALQMGGWMGKGMMYGDMWW